MQPRKVCRRQESFDLGDDSLGVGESARADVAPGESTDRWLEDRHTPTTKRGDVVGDCRVFPHLGVHCWTHQHGCTCRDQRCHCHVARNAGRIGADQASRCWRHHDQVRTLRESRMWNWISVVPQCRSHWFGGKSRQRRLANEVFGIARHDRRNVRTHVDHPSTHLDGLVCRDPTGDDENDVLSR